MHMFSGYTSRSSRAEEISFEGKFYNLADICAGAKQNNSIDVNPIALFRIFFQFPFTSLKHFTSGISFCYCSWADSFSDFSISNITHPSSSLSTTPFIPSLEAYAGWWFSLFHHLQLAARLIYLTKLHECQFTISADLGLLQSDLFGLLKYRKTAR